MHKNHEIFCFSDNICLCNITYGVVHIQPCFKPIQSKRGWGDPHFPSKDFFIIAALEQFGFQSSNYATFPEIVIGNLSKCVSLLPLVHCCHGNQIFWRLLFLVLNASYLDNF